jgi:hypothetical protein
VRFELPTESGDALEDNCAVSSRPRSKRAKESLPEDEEESDGAEQTADAKHRKQVSRQAP